MDEVSFDQWPRRRIHVFGDGFCGSAAMARSQLLEKEARAILRLWNGARRMRIEPFSILIFCTADPKVADAKTRSKWSVHCGTPK